MSGGRDGDGDCACRAPVRTPPIAIEIPTMTIWTVAV